MTDKFLWDVYNLLEKTDETLGILMPPVRMKEAIYPDLRKLREKYEKERMRRTFSQFINYLKRKGYIKIKTIEGKQAILITKNGINKALKAKFRMVEKKKRKDGKWIMLIYDIPETKKSLRHLLREMLYIFGYRMFQKSVWICPYDVLEETENFIQRNSLDKYVRIFLIEEIIK